MIPLLHTATHFCVVLLHQKPELQPQLSQLSVKVPELQANGFVAEHCPSRVPSEHVEMHVSSGWQTNPAGQPQVLHLSIKLPSEQNLGIFELEQNPSKVPSAEHLSTQLPSD